MSQDRRRGRIQETVQVYPLLETFLLQCVTRRSVYVIFPLNKCVCPGPECQKLDWPSHKTQCKATPHWYDKYRRCGQKEFGQKEKHEGELELITWACPEEGTGWGSCFTEESDDLRRKFEIEFGGDLEKFYKYWPQGFRWRCCGAAGNVTYGCDHHGRGKKPCSCDFCK